jgi:hypothetical protein
LGLVGPGGPYVGPVCSGAVIGPSNLPLPSLRRVGEDHWRTQAPLGEPSNQRLGRGRGRVRLPAPRPCCVCLHTPTRPHTHSLTPSHTHSLTCTPTHNPSHALPDTLPHTHSLTHTPSHALPHTLPRQVPSHVRDGDPLELLVEAWDQSPEAVPGQSSTFICLGALDLSLLLPGLLTAAGKGPQPVDVAMTRTWGVAGSGRPLCRVPCALWATL